jgi:type IV pilus secretin PilQ/predicted competence protein
MNSYRWFRCLGVLFALSLLASPIHGCATGGTPPTGVAGAPENSITLDSVRELDDSVAILVTGTGVLNYTPYRLESPLRLVVDVPDAVFVDAGVDVPVEGGTVSKISKRDMTSEGKKVARLEIYLVGDTNYLISKPSENQIQIEIQKPTGGTAVEEPAPPAVGREPVRMTFPPATKIINVVADDSADGTLVTILTDGSVENFESFVLEDPFRLVVDIKGLKNTFPTKEVKVGGGDVKLIRIGTYPEKTRVVMESAVPGHLNTYNVFPLDNKLMVSFRKAGEDVLGAIPQAPPKSVPEVTPKEEAPPVVTPPAELPTTELAPSVGLAQPPEAAPGPPATLPGETPLAVESTVVPPGAEIKAPGAEMTGEKVYTGKPMTLIFSNAKVKDLINLIAEFSNVSIVIKPDVSDALKLSLRLKKVPWDQALDLIVSLSGLGMVQRGNVIIVTTKAKLDEEIQSEYKFKMNLEDVAPLVTRQVNVVYRKNPAPTTTTGTATTATTEAVDIVAAIKNAKMISTRGSIAWAPSGDMIIVTDTQTKVDEIVQMIRLLDTPEKEPEVRIEARVVEINDTYKQDLGIKWVGGYNGSEGDESYKGSLGLLETTDINNDDNFDITKMIFPALPASAFMGGIPGGATAMIGLLDNALRLDVQLHALETMNEAQIIESPKIRVLNNKKATITVSTIIPIANPSEKESETGAITTTSQIEEKEFKTELIITPTVNPDGRIKLDLDLTHDSQGDAVVLKNPSGIENTYYITLRRHLQTFVMADNRDTIVIGGLYRKENQTIDSGLPTLKDIPLLGWLFKTRNKGEVRREMLIFITPTIVRGGNEVTSGK